MTSAEAYCVSSRVALPSFVAATLLGLVLAVLLGLLDKTGDSVLPAGTPVVARVLLGSRGEAEVNMRVPLDPKRPYVFMANHASMVGHLGDVRGVAGPGSASSPRSSSPASRSSVGRCVRGASSSSIGRTRPRPGAASTRRRAASRRPVGDYLPRRDPHPRRQKRAPFKKGGFHLAMDSGVEIVPVAIIGRPIMPRGSALIRRGRGAPGGGRADRHRRSAHRRSARPIARVHGQSPPCSAKRYSPWWKSRVT